MAKFYYSNSKMVWETIQEGLKSKMEIKCSDICALKITCQKKLPGGLDIMVRERELHIMKIIMLMGADYVVW